LPLAEKARIPKELVPVEYQSLLAISTTDVNAVAEADKQVRVLPAIADATTAWLECCWLDAAQVWSPSRVQAANRRSLPSLRRRELPRSPPIP
jgi:hypothetical protein